MKDPWDGVIPLKPPSNEPAHLARISQPERKQRRKQRAANRPIGEMPQTGGRGTGKGRSKKLINSAELEEMLSASLRKHYDDSMESPRAQDRKYAATSFGIMVDKYHLVRGKPTAIVGFADAEAARPGLLELAKVIASEGA